MVAGAGDAASTLAGAVGPTVENAAALASGGAPGAVGAAGTVAEMGAANLNTAAQTAGGGALSQAGKAVTSAMSKGGPAGNNWLSKAAGKAWDFVNTDAGSNLVGNILQGYGSGVAAKEQQRHEARYDRMWQDPSQTGAIEEQAASFDPNVPDNWNRNPQTLVEQRQADYTPSVPLRRSTANAGG